ncbi:MAG: histidine--tRNA ligase, partial [Gammaproteobacteria bacterium]
MLLDFRSMADSGHERKPQKFAAPRGTSDILPEDWVWWRHVRDTAERVCDLFGYRRIETPVFEHAGVYLRTAGAGTDVVEKEVYLFDDRGGDRLALRPEGTAGVVRAYIEHGMSSVQQPVRLFYMAPNFRYDRPQAGRYRQHTQFGAEAIGDPHPMVDAEILDLLTTFYRELGLRDFTLRLNSIGDAVCRPKFIEALREYYRPKLDRVCDDDRARFEKNPMRLLDCKDPRCHEIIAGAPRLPDYLCDACREHFVSLRSYLDALEIDYELDDRLVRGLDYY